MGLGLAAVSPAFGQEATTGLPGGAQSLTEEHGDWTVSCRMQDSEKLCVMSQTLADSQTGQPVLSIELATPAVDRVEGMLLLPFGLRLSEGVSLAADDAAIGATWPFLTCIATGCLIPVVFDAEQVSALRSGGALKIAASNAGTAQPVALEISLAGFSRAANRSVELSL